MLRLLHPQTAVALLLRISSATLRLAADLIDPPERFAEGAGPARPVASGDGSESRATPPAGEARPPARSAPPSARAHTPRSTRPRPAAAVPPRARRAAPSAPPGGTPSTRPSPRPAPAPRRGERDFTLVAESADPGAAAGAGAQVRVDEPWSGYAAMRAPDVIERLSAQGDSALAVILLYESSHRARRTILAAAERELRRRSSGADS